MSFSALEFLYEVPFFFKKILFVQQSLSMYESMPLTNSQCAPGVVLAHGSVLSLPNSGEACFSIAHRCMD